MASSRQLSRTSWRRSSLGCGAATMRALGAVCGTAEMWSRAGPVRVWAVGRWRRRLERRRTWMCRFAASPDGRTGKQPVIPGRRRRARNPEATTVRDLGDAARPAMTAGSGGPQRASRRPHLDNVPILCFLAAPAHGASGAIPRRPSGARPVADRAGPWVRAVPASVALSRHRPGRRTGTGRVSVAGVRPGGALPGGCGNAPAPTRFWADPERPADPPTTRRDGWKATALIAGSGGACASQRPLGRQAQVRGVERHRDEKDGTGRGPCPVDAAGAAGIGSRALTGRHRVPAASRVPRDLPGHAPGAKGARGR